MKTNDNDYIKKVLEVNPFESSFDEFDFEDYWIPEARDRNMSVHVPLSRQLTLDHYFSRFPTRSPTVASQFTSFRSIEDQFDAYEKRELLKKMKTGLGEYDEVATATSPSAPPARAIETLLQKSSTGAGTAGTSGSARTGKWLFTPPNIYQSQPSGGIYPPLARKEFVTVNMEKRKESLAKAAVTNVVNAQAKPATRTPTAASTSARTTPATGNARTGTGTTQGAGDGAGGAGTPKPKPATAATAPATGQTRANQIIATNTVRRVKEEIASKVRSIMVAQILVGTLFLALILCPSAWEDRIRMFLAWRSRSELCLLWLGVQVVGYLVFELAMACFSKRQITSIAFFLVGALGFSVILNTIAHGSY